MKKPYSGGWVDERIPDEAIRIIADLPGDPEILQRRIAALLGAYRDWLKLRETTPTPTEVQKHIEKAAGQSRKLAQSMELLPAEMGHEIKRRGVFTADGETGRSPSEIAQQLQRQAALFDKWGSALLGVSGKAGKKHRTLEHRLLSDTAHYLEEMAGQNKTTAANLAVDILQACGVEYLPQSETDVPSALRKDQPRSAIKTYRKNHPLKPPGL
jgi:hypothetical protein